MAAFWTGSQWKDIEIAEYLDYEDENWFLPNPTKRKMQTGRPWETKRSCYEYRGYSWKYPMDKG